VYGGGGSRAGEHTGGASPPTRMGPLTADLLLPGPALGADASLHSTRITVGIGGVGDGGALFALVLS
jgi:hypothetical protein